MNEFLKEHHLEFTCASAKNETVLGTVNGLTAGVGLSGVLVCS